MKINGAARLAAIILGIAASLLAVMAVALYEGYFPASWCDNFTFGELGGLAALCVAGAIGCSFASRSYE